MNQRLFFIFEMCRAAWKKRAEELIAFLTSLWMML